MKHRALLLWLLFFALLPPSGVRAAETKTFSIAGASVILDDFSAELDVYFRSMRFNRAQQVWNADVVLSNRSTVAISGPFVLQITSASATTTRPVTPDGVQEGKPFFDLSSFVPTAVLKSGETS